MSVFRYLSPLQSFDLKIENKVLKRQPVLTIEPIMNRTRRA